MKTTILLVVALAMSSPCLATGDKRLDNVRQVMPGLYAGEGKSPAGETLYFGLEEITQTNHAAIEAFKVLSDSLFADRISMITVPVMMCARGGNFPAFSTVKGTRFEKAYGFTQAEYETFFGKLCHGSGDLNKLVEKLKGVSDGGHFMMNEVGDYIAYISKKPVTQPLNWKLTKESSAKEYMAETANLIISVGVRMKEPLHPDAFQNRGIAKSFHAVLAGGYADVSIPFHGFTAAAAKKFFGKKVFIVQANLMMTGILKKKLKPTEYENFQAAGGGDTGFKIPVDAMIDFYAGVRK